MGRSVAVSFRVWIILVSFQIAAVFCEHTLLMHNVTEMPDGIDYLNSANEITARGKKKKKLKLLIIAGIALIKAILYPLALKAVAILSGKAFFLSALSLILSSIIGLKSYAQPAWDRVAQMSSMMRDRGEVTETYHHPPAVMPTEAMYHKIHTDQYWARDFKNK